MSRHRRREVGKPSRDHDGQVLQRRSAGMGPQRLAFLEKEISVRGSREEESDEPQWQRAAEEDGL